MPNKTKKMSDGLTRTIIGIVLAGFLFLILWLASFSQIIFDIFVLLFGAFATYEMYRAIKKADTGVIDKRGYNISKWSMILLLIIIYPLCYLLGMTGLLFAFILALLLAFVEFIFDSKKTLSDFGVNIFALIYPLFMLGIVFVMGRIYGMIPILLAIGVALISDACAYWIGVKFGKKKIFPTISPKKTVEGSIAGIAGGILGAIIVYLIFELGKFPTNTLFTFGLIVKVPFLLYALTGAILAVFSELGDLAASRIKRAAGIKDYGSILGAHGGALDRIDSILFSSVAMLLLVRLFLAF